jgi:translation initiation factor IF-3
VNNRDTSNINSKKDEPRINNDILAETVRVLDETGNPIGIMSIQEALTLADEDNKDLIEISPEANPPVVKVIEYGKWKYNKLKSVQKNKENKTTKEVRFSISISDNDLQTKIKMIEKFLKQGNNVLIKVIMRGRERVRQQLGSEKMDKIAGLVKPMSKSVGEIKIEKNVIHCMFFS